MRKVSNILIVIECIMVMLRIDREAQLAYRHTDGEWSPALSQEALCHVFAPHQKTMLPLVLQKYLTLQLFGCIDIDSFQKDLSWALIHYGSKVVIPVSSDRLLRT